MSSEKNVAQVVAPTHSASSTVVAVAVPANGEDVKVMGQANPVASYPVQAVRAQSVASVVGVRLVESTALSGAPVTVRAVAEDIGAGNGGTLIQPIEGSVTQAHRLAMERVREEARSVRDGSGSTGTTFEFTQHHSPNDHVIGPIAGSHKNAHKLAQERQRQEAEAIRSGNYTGYYLQPREKPVTEMTMRVQVPSYAHPDSVITVTFPPGTASGLAGTTLDVRIPSTASAGSIIEVTFDVTGPSKEELKAEAAQQERIQREREAYEKQKQEEESNVQVGRSGGYQTKDYDVQEYSSVYGSGGYQCSDYKSIYD